VVNSSTHSPAHLLQTSTDIAHWLADQCAIVLGVEVAEIALDEPFDALGLSSRDLITLSGDLENWLGLSLDPTIAYQHVTIASLSEYLADLQRASRLEHAATQTALTPAVTLVSTPMSHGAVSAASKTDQRIAIIGASGRFPKAETLEAYWELLIQGRDAITDVPPARLAAKTYDHAAINSTSDRRTNWGGYLAQVDQFDPMFFGISPREALYLDPQQRLLLEVTWEALEDVGITPSQLAGSDTGVFIGIATHDYAALQKHAPEGIHIYASTGSASSIAANRISYCLDLHGPSMAIDTACSSSLVALHLACQSLRAGECQLGLVGGVNVILSPEWTEPFAQAGLIAPDGRCKTFDAAANGYVRGEGCGVIVLKRLSDAVRDNDHVLAIIRGSAVNQDGRSNGLVAPNGSAQEAVIRAALQDADTKPSDISYVEAHGTGTELGDPIEWNALSAVLLAQSSAISEERQSCAIGSVKTNIGHLEAAAGIAGLLKVVLALKHETIPPHLHFQRLNPHLSQTGARFVIPVEPRPWQRGRAHRIAGLSSFGFGGTNAHIILEEAPLTQSASPSHAWPWNVLTLSAPNPTALDQATTALVEALSAHPKWELADVAFTHQEGRKAFPYRRMLVASSVEDAARAFNSHDPKRVVDGMPNAGRGLGGHIAFMFSGLGDQAVGMGQALYQHVPAFRVVVDECAALLKPYLGQDIRTLVFPNDTKRDEKPSLVSGSGSGPGIDLRALLGRAPARQTTAGATSISADADVDIDWLNQTSLAHPAIFVIEYALAKLWLSLGIKPDCVLGYSIGEYVAACLAGVFSLEDALTLIARRSQLIERLPEGAMLAVPLSEADLQPYLHDALSIAAVNGSERCVVAGALEAIHVLDHQLNAREIVTRRLSARHAFHSTQMQPITDAFAQVLDSVQLHAPNTRFVSSVTGDWVNSADITCSDYWIKHLWQPVRFSAALHSLSALNSLSLIEIGPGQALCSIAWQFVNERVQQADQQDQNWMILPSLHSAIDGQPDLAVMLKSLGKLWLSGKPVNWSGLYVDQRRNRLSLPTTPFMRQRYWIEPKQSVSISSTLPTSAPHSTFIPVSTTVEEHVHTSKPKPTSFTGSQADEVSAQDPAQVVTQAPVQADVLAQLVINRTREIVARLLRSRPDQVDVHAPFLEMGADSIVLTQAIRAIEKEFGVEIGIRQLFEELTTIADVATYVAARTPAHALVAPLVYEQASAAASDVPNRADPIHAIVNMPAPAIPVPERISAEPDQAVSLGYAATQLASATSTASAAPVPSAVTPIVQAQLAVFAQMTQVMSQQLALLGDAQPEEMTTRPAPTLPLTPIAPKSDASMIPAQPTVSMRPPNGNAAYKNGINGHSGNDHGGNGINHAMAPQRATLVAPVTPANKPYVPYQPIRIERTFDAFAGLNDHQRAYLAEFAERYVSRRPQSKDRTQHYRAPLADNRASVGFRFSIKEMLFPIIAERSAGAHVWDVDGNAYIDLTMGFGVNLLGHNAPFIKAAVTEQLQRGLHLGPQSDLAGQVAERLCRITGMERIAFCNSGTEAVMMALRLARTATGRTKIVQFAGSYHGISDATLVVAEDEDGATHTVPMAPGVLPGIAGHTLVLDYGSPNSLAAIRAHAHELAAVLVEPVQSRRPDLQPIEFLRELRSLTEEHGIALIFDEMITGFRCHMGGAQAYFGLRADLATYGKIVGGGLPIGVVAGCARFMDGIDGGTWQYGDGSYPSATTTFFAGTFCKHPLTMAAALATLEYLEAEGPALQAKLNTRTQAFVARVNSFFESEAVPIRMNCFSSLMRFDYAGNMDLFFYHLVEKGVYVWEGRTLFLSTAHSDDDLQHIEAVIRESIADLRRGGFLPDKPQALSLKESSKHNDSSEHLAGIVAPVAATISTAPTAPNTQISHATQVLPLTAMQQEIWLQTQLSEGAAKAYHNVIALQLDGVLRLPLLQQALTQVVARHDALRTIFDREGRHQTVLPQASIDLAFDDLSNLADAEQRKAIDRATHASSQHLLDLTYAPLLCVSALKLGATRHVLLIAAHQIVADGISLALIARELSVIYSALCQSSPPALPPAMPFGAYADWHDALLHGPKTAAAERFWLQTFAGEVPVLDLPVDHARMPSESYAAARHTLHIQGALFDGIQKLAASSRATVFMLMLSAFKVLLYRLSGQRDVVVGVPTAGRPDVDNEEQALVGGCINLFPVRTRLSDEHDFAQTLNDVKQTLLDALEHAHYPFDLLVRKLNPPREPGRWPLVSVFFNLDRPQDVSQFHGLECSVLPHAIQYANFDLNVNILHLPDSLTVELDYNQSLFTEETIRHWSGYLVTLLEGIVTQSSQRLLTLPLLSEQDSQRILHACNAESQALRFQGGVHRLVEHWAAATPLAVAITVPHQLDLPGDRSLGERRPAEQLTYAELNARANRLARHLRYLGVAAETIVAICLDRSADFVVALLATLKAGGAYLPLDPTYPPERLAGMLADANAQIVITQTALCAVLQSRTPAYSLKTVLLDQGAQDIAVYESSNLDIPMSMEQLAYVIFTSGSTGRPKGVMVRHLSLLNAFFAWQKAYRLDSDARVHLQMASMSFDVGTGDVVRALCSGGRLVVCPRETLLDAPALHALMVAEQVSCAEFVPATLRALMTHLERAHQQLTHVRVLVCGSDSWHAGEYERFRYWCGPHTRLLNSFGITEATIDTTAFESDSLDLGAERLVPIGRPLANMRAYVLNRALQLVPPGVAGELYIGGLGVARGYLKGPEQTAQRFVPDPFSPALGARLYRTGDQARYLADGNIEFLGRDDVQVKIRGHRIEPGEIEAVLERHHSVKQALVVPVVKGLNNANASASLIAYIVLPPALPVPQAGASADVDHDAPAIVNRLRHYLAEHLPDYMLPSTIEVREALPLTANGKVDRAALMAEARELPTVEDHIVAPSTPTEQALVGIWAEVLGLSQVGVHSNFFFLGGHSLMVAQVISRVRTTFGLDVPLRLLFDAPTVAGMAAAIECMARDAATAPPPIVARSDATQPVPLSSAQNSLWFVDRLMPGSAYVIANALKIQGTLNLAALHESLRLVAERHDQLRTVFRSESGIAHQVVLEHMPFGLETHDLTTTPPPQRSQAIEHMVLGVANQKFDLEHGPLWSARLLKFNANDHVLLLAIHHIVADGWSMGVLINELTAIYDSLTSGRAPTLPELPIRYADYAVWQQEQLTSGAWRPQLEYWRTQLAGAPQSIDLIADHPRPAQQSFRGATLRVPLSPELTRKVRRLSQSHNVTLFMTLFAAYAALLHRYTGQTDLVLGTPVANRVSGETEALVGFFVNLLPLRLNLSGDPTFADVLAQTRRTALDGFTHQNFPFERLVSELALPRDPSRHPLFQVAFVLQNAPMPPVSLSGVSFDVLPVDYGTSRFDLTLLIEEGDDELVALLEYNTDLFDHGSIARLSSHFELLLHNAVITPYVPISSLNIIGDAERNTLMTVWNATQRDYERATSIPTLFSDIARVHPDAIALMQAGTVVTYAQLDFRANRLARRLHAAGVRTEHVVAVALDRSPDLIVALLAILKAGAAYLALDPALPAPRVAFMLADAGVRVVVTAVGSPHNLPIDGQQVICVDADSAGSADDADGAEVVHDQRTISAENIAYVAYTSGSTGVPKGVRVTHRGVLRLVRNSNYATFRPQDVFLQLAPIAFDASTLEIWGALLNAARLVLYPPEPFEAATFAALVAEQHVSVLWLTAGLFHQVIDLRVDALVPIRQVFAGGDVLSQAHVMRLLEAREAAGVVGAVINGYGPTENTTFTTAWPMHHPTDLDGAAQVPIGAPIANTSAYALDRWAQPVGVGMVGELFTGGDGLARDYLNRPDLTAERFMPNPFGPPGSRLYRTGDLVRWTEAGELAFVGRADQQVKIRGYRIELGEIERVLAAHPSVADAVVDVREDVPSHKRLVAYVVGTGKTRDVDGDGLSVYLATRLPDYMVPGAFVALDALPLTVNGKVDRKALPQPTQPEPALTVDAAPQGPVEQVLAELWRDVLGVATFGRHDSFFALGGDSILSIQFVARAADAGLKLTPRQIFQHQTIAELATVVNTAPVIQADQSMVMGDVPLAPIQHWFFGQHLAEPTHFNQSIWLRVAPQVPAEHIEQALNAVLLKHDALRLCFEPPLPNGETWQQMHRPLGQPMPFESVCLQECVAHDAQQMQTALERIAAEAQTRLNITTGPMLYATHVQVPEQSASLLLVAHHLVIDGISWRILVADLETACRQLAAHQPIELGPKTTSFQHWTGRLVDYAQTAQTSDEAPYWLGLPWDKVSALPIDTGQTRSANTVAQSASLAMALDERETEALVRQLPDVYRAQPAELLLAALGYALAHWTGSSEHLIDLEGHGREDLFSDVDLSRTVGWFTAIAPMFISVDQSDDMPATLRSVKESARRVPNGGLRFGLLRYLNGDAALAKQLACLPRAQISFNYLGHVNVAGESDRLFALANETTGGDVAAANTRTYLIEVNAQIVRGRLTVHWVYDSHSHRPETIERVASDFAQALRQLIVLASDGDARRSLTPSDFPLADLDSDELEAAFGSFEGFGAEA